MNNPTQPLLISPKTAAEMLSISERSLWKSTFEIDVAIPHLKIGRLTRYRVADIQKWIDARKHGAPSYE